MPISFPLNDQDSVSARTETMDVIGTQVIPQPLLNGSEEILCERQNDADNDNDDFWKEGADDPQEEVSESGNDFVT